MKLIENRFREFRGVVWEYYLEHGRELPWREEPYDPYRILVSEVMLQQTQAPRVIPKYRSFLERFPTITDLAKAPLGDVLREWSGLGYNRRAQYLHTAAKQLQHKAQPWTPDDLSACKGIGVNTAAAVCVYAYEEPLVFIETNIRTVYIHHFFAGRDDVTDKEILELVTQTLPNNQEVPTKPVLRGEARNPLGVSHYRAWYWALMDYGTYLKRSSGNSARRSRHYVKQTAFEGSLRQLRGKILKALATDAHTMAELEAIVADDRLSTALNALVAEDMIVRGSDRFHL